MVPQRWESSSFPFSAGKAQVFCSALKAQVFRSALKAQVFRSALGKLKLSVQRWESSSFPFSAGKAQVFRSALGKLKLSVQRSRFLFRKDCRVGEPEPRPTCTCQSGGWAFFLRPGFLFDKRNAQGFSFVARNASGFSFVVRHQKKRPMGFLLGQIFVFGLW